MNDKIKKCILTNIEIIASLLLLAFILFYASAAVSIAAPSVNINEASFEKLLDLEGINEDSAAKIIKYRRENNGFKTIYDLLKVEGINGETFEKIKDNITAGAVSAQPKAPQGDTRVKPPVLSPPPPSQSVKPSGGGRISEGSEDNSSPAETSGGAVPGPQDADSPSNDNAAPRPAEKEADQGAAAVADDTASRESEHSFEEGRKTSAPRKQAPAGGLRSARIGGDIKRIELTPENYYKVIIGLMRLAKYDKAETNIADFVKKFPSDKRVDDMNYLMGACLEEDEKYKEAVELYEKVYENQNSELRAIALFRMGVCNDLMGNAAQALDSYRKYVSSFSSSACVKEAENRINEMLKTK